MNDRIIGFGALGCVAFTAAFIGTGFNMNFSGSAPVGVWKERPIGKTLKRGDLVGVCPPDSPVVARMAAMKQTPQWDCINTGLSPLLKAIGAVSGDLVVIRQRYPVLVNGNALPNTISSPKLPAWPDGKYRVKPGEVWLFSTYHSQSFDSRYFGPVSIKNIKVRAEPVLVAGNSNNMRIGVPHD